MKSAPHVTLPVSSRTPEDETITTIKIGPEDKVSVQTHYGDHGKRTYREIVIQRGHDKQK